MGFSAIDYVVLLVYLVGITIFGTLFRRSHQSVKDYFVGTKTTHWLVISLSIVATETSTLTLIGVPALAYTPLRASRSRAAAFTYLQVVFGYIIARVIISFLFIPAYFQGELLTAYELLARRFGAATKHFAASLFLVMRALAEGVRVFAASLVLAAVIGASLPGLPHLWLWSIVLVGPAHADLHVRGGHRGGHLDGPDPAGHLHRRLAAGRVAAAPHDAGRLAGDRRQAEAADKFQLFSFSWDLTLPFTFWAGLIGGTFLTMASHGTDQLLVQRLLTCRNQRDSQKALIASGFIVLFQFALFLLDRRDAVRATTSTRRCRRSTSNDEIFPMFIVHNLPHGIAGLVIAADLRGGDVEPERVAQLAGVDDRARLLQAARSAADRTDAQLLRLSRWCTAAWGVVLIAHCRGRQRLGLGVHRRPVDRLARLRPDARRVPARRPDQAREPAGRHGRHRRSSLGCMLLVKVYTPLAWTWYVLVGHRHLRHRRLRGEPRGSGWRAADGAVGDGRVVQAVPGSRIGAVPGRRARGRRRHALRRAAAPALGAPVADGPAPVLPAALHARRRGRRVGPARLEIPAGWHRRSRSPASTRSSRSRREAGLQGARPRGGRDGQVHLVQRARNRARLSPDGVADGDRLRRDGRRRTSALGGIRSDGGRPRAPGRAPRPDPPRDAVAHHPGTGGAVRRRC